jgi:hypothetical protein
MSAELLPCPFCGEEPRPEPFGRRWSVRCCSDACESGRVEVHAETLEGVTAAWNHRAPACISDPDFARRHAEDDAQLLEMLDLVVGIVRIGRNATSEPGRSKSEKTNLMKGAMKPLHVAVAKVFVAIPRNAAFPWTPPRYRAFVDEANAILKAQRTLPVKAALPVAFESVRRQAMQDVASRAAAEAARPTLRTLENIFYRQSKSMDLDPPRGMPRRRPEPTPRTSTTRSDVYRGPFEIRSRMK